MSKEEFERLRSEMLEEFLMSKQNKKEKKLNIGEQVFNLFKEKLSNNIESWAEKEKKEIILGKAASLVKDLPFVTYPFKENGIMQGGRDVCLLYTFKPNLWAQDYAFEIGQLDKMIIENSLERAFAVTDFVIEKSNLNFLYRLLKRNGKTEFDYLNAMRDAILIESAYYSRIGGEEMPEEYKNNIDIGLIKRALVNKSSIRTTAKNQGVNTDDNKALLQFSKAIDLVGFLQDIGSIDPYFNRRQKQISKFTNINSESSFNKPDIKGGGIVKELVQRLMKKGKVEPWLIKEVEKSFQLNS